MTRTAPRTDRTLSTVVVAAVLLGVALLVALGWALVIFGGISMAIRRGAFSPRQRP